MNRIQTCPRVYQHRGVQIEALATRLAGPQGWLHWQIHHPAGSTAVSFARSLSEARELIEQL